MKNSLPGDCRLAKAVPDVSRLVPPLVARQVGVGSGTHLGVGDVQPLCKQYAKVAPVRTVPGSQCQTATSPQPQKPLPDTLPWMGTPGSPHVNAATAAASSSRSSSSSCSLPTLLLLPVHRGSQGKRAAGFGPTSPTTALRSSGLNPAGTCLLSNFPMFVPSLSW